MLAAALADAWHVTLDVTLTGATERRRNVKADDAKIVGWVQGGWLALAVADDNAYGVGYEYGNGSNSAHAETTPEQKKQNRRNY